MKQCLTLAIVVLIFIVPSCKKDGFITGDHARLSTSADTLHFDTVFTTTGSVTQFFRIYNQNNQNLLLSAVKLNGGSSSPFKLNVDGISGSEIRDVEIDANDSIYVFVTVKINPAAIDLPFVVQDSVLIQFNGNERWVQLEAWGQNANFFRSRLITADEIWTNDRPYVILAGIQIGVGTTLTITKGCRIYMHADAPFIVDGTLHVNGEKYDSTRVIFRGDRLDEPYRDFPAGWPGIYFRETSKDSRLDFAIISNAYQGVVVDKPSLNANPKLRLNECIIENCYDAGIFGLRSDITARNCLISNSGKNIVLAYGGNYDFTHCTDVAYSNSYILHKDPVLLVTNFIKEGTNILTANLNANFRNCIFWGDNGTVDDEVVINKQGNSSFVANFQNCLWKVKTTPGGITSSNIIANDDPQFDSVNTQKRIYNFRLKNNSPAINKGIVTAIPFDLDGVSRNVGIPDLGSYEKQ